MDICQFFFHKNRIFQEKPLSPLSPRALARSRNYIRDIT